MKKIISYSPFETPIDGSFKLAIYTTDTNQKFIIILTNLGKNLTQIEIFEEIESTILSNEIYKLPIIGVYLSFVNYTVEKNQIHSFYCTLNVFIDILTNLKKKNAS